MFLFIYRESQGTGWLNCWIFSFPSIHFLFIHWCS